MQNETGAGTGWGDGCVASEAWLRKQSGARPRDWHRLMAEIHAALSQLCRHPLIVEDRVSRAIILEMVKAANMEEIAFQADLLSLRVNHLFLEKVGRDPRENAILVVRQASQRAVLHRATIEGDDHSRTVLRL